MSEPPGIAFLVAAAGRGSRIGNDIPKQYRILSGFPVLTYTLRALLSAVPDAVALTLVHGDDRALYASAIAALGPSLAARMLPPALGGATRQETVHAGLEALAALEPTPKFVLIHDAARPFVATALISRTIAVVQQYGAAVPGLRATDTVKQVHTSGRILATLDRSELRTIQTPQAFVFPLILDAHRRAALAGLHDLTDDAAVAEWAGHSVYICEGEAGNMKITTLDDLAAAAKRTASAMDVRTGQGFDVHAFGPGGQVWLGGIVIPHTQGLVGHSDADVLLHAITDAVLGAIADGDIGQHFPPSDLRWKGAASSIFLTDAVARVHRLGGNVRHIDATIVCEEPKIGPHRDAIRASVASIAGLEPGRVAVKATTSERLGFTGRREGIAAMAIATVALP